ncbi:EAL domain-containing protein, partial [Enterobacter cloacae]|nr:EAL domain-containing protein [Enterobacter cloacae]
MRWIHPQHGMISPAKFIAVAEETGIASKITQQIMKQTQECIRAFPGDPPAGMVLSFNVCSGDFRTTALLESCRNLSRNLADIAPLIVLEITERHINEDVNSLEWLVHALKHEGVQFALDDFGTGNSNLDLIDIFRPDFIKIDKNFVQRSTSEKACALLINNIIDVARNFNCLTVAEGI